MISVFYRAEVVTISLSSVVVVVLVTVAIVAVASMWLFQRRKRSRRLAQKEEEAEIVRLSMKVGEYEIATHRCHHVLTMANVSATASKREIISRKLDSTVDVYRRKHLPNVACETIVIAALW